MKFIVEELRRQEEMLQLPVIKMEIDYELMTLYDALQDNDTVAIIKAKERLKELRLKQMKLESNK